MCKIIRRVFPGESLSEESLAFTTATNVEVSVAACDLEHWLDFVYMAGFGHPPDHVTVGLTHNTAMKTGKVFAHANTILGGKPQETRRPDLDRRGIRGYTVRDPRGQTMGRAERLFLNESDEPEYILVKLGFFGFKTALIPVQGVLTDEERRALVPQ